MRKETASQLQLIKLKIENHPGLKAYCNKNGKVAARRFWHLFRSDLMRKSPQEVAGYLRNRQLKLADVSTEDRQFGPELADEFFGNRIADTDLRINQEALIYACLELDAAWKLALSGIDKKDTLRDKLKLWRVP